MALPSSALTTTSGVQVAPSLRGLPYFERTQDWMFRIVAWDTPQTALQASTATQGLQLRVVEPKTASWATYVSELTGATDVNLVTKFENGTVLVNDGRWGIAQAYWGGGAPNWWGATQPGKVAVLFKGSLVSTARRAWLTSLSSFGFAVAGSGKIRIDKVNDTNGTRTTVLPWTDLTEGNYLEEGFVYSTPSDFAGCRVEVFYVQTDANPWGGLVVKAVPTTSWPAGADDKAALAAAAPVLSGGLFAYGTSPVFDTVGSSHVSAAQLPFILETAVVDEPGSATRMTFDVPLVNGLLHDGHGWVYNRANDETDPGYLELFDGGALATFTLRRKRLVQLQVALQSSSPTWTPIFTGHVHDFSGNSEGRLTVECLSYETRMVEQYEQLPDRVSYMSRGYRTVDFFDIDAPTEEPVYNIPAFDHWPLEWAVEELGVRAGIDPSCFRANWTELNAAGTQTQIQLPWNSTPKRFRAESLSGSKVQLPRPVHYGNAGVAFTETRPFDDQYVFRVEPTKDLWARSRDLTDKMGYTWRFNAAGEAVLSATNVPVLAHDFVPANATAGSATEVVNPSAYGAKYLRTTAGVTLQATVRASRIDASFPRQFGLNTWTVSIARSSAPGTAIYTATVAPSTGISGTLPKVYTLYDSPTTSTGTNASLITLFSGDYDQYIVTLTCGAGEGLVDCLLAYAVDPDNTVLPTLSVADTATSVQVKPQQDGTRNKVTIVGRRKGAVTDSDKFAEAQAPTEQEFVVANAVDVDSITNPAATNYVGYLKQSVIYDDSITDDGFAQYLAQVYIYRQRTPQPGTNVQHPLLPIVRISDPVAVADTKYDTTKEATRQYVRRIEHRIGLDKFTTTLDTSAWPEFPAYQPRTDISLANFNNKPVIDLAINYKSLAGYDITNPVDGKGVPPVGSGTYDWVVTVPQSEYVLLEDVAVTNHPVSGECLLLGSSSWPPLPGTLQVQPRDITPASGAISNGAWVPGFGVSGLSTGSVVTTLELLADQVLAYVEVRVNDNFYTSPFGDKVNDSWTYVAIHNNPTAAFWYTRSGVTITVFRGSGSITGQGPNSPGRLSDMATTDSRVRYYTSAEDRRIEWFANTPYHEFTRIDYRDVALPEDRCRLVWSQAGGYLRPSVTTSYDVRYRPFFTKTGSNPISLPAGVTTNGEPFSAFYDPYTSELGYLVNVSMNVLANGLYRVSVRSAYDDTVVAWLTNTTADAGEPDQHWEYIPITANKTFTWDGVDQVGSWNAAQSELYERLIGGAFNENEPVRVGRGYYVWNREVKGSTVADQAYIWMKRDANGKPVIGHGTYAAWYINVETISEALTTPGRKAVVTSLDAPWNDPDRPKNAVVLTHLPEPTKLELKIQDYTGTEPSGSWASVPTSAFWTGYAPAQSDLTAYINNSKPVRLRFKVADRPGALWTGRQGEVSVKLTREVHLRAFIADQVVSYAGKEFPGTTHEERTIYNRRLVNDEHTKQYKDSGFRRANTFKWEDADAQATEWVFRPSDFKKDFVLNGVEESIEFGNYLQLEEVPNWAGERGIAAVRSRLNCALMSYLFYLSAFVTDRSGRSTWGVNRSFVDRSKITLNTQTTDFTDDPMYQLRRTVVCRQWTDEPNWKSGQRTTWNYGATSLFDKLLQHWWWQHEITSTTIGTDLTTWAAFQLTRDHYSWQHRSGGVDGNFVLPGEYGNTAGQFRYNRQLGEVTGGTETSPTLANHLGKLTGGSLTNGNWTWQTNPAWIPSFTRDFHPYFLLPPMVSPLHDGATEGLETQMNTRNCYTDVGSPGVRIRKRDRTEVTRRDAAASETWTSGIYDMGRIAPDPDFSPALSNVRFWPGKAVDNTLDPFKNNITSTTLNYVRQDETVHWEDLRGVYSRGKYPTAQPIKVTSGNPYYLNQFRYYGIETSATLNVSSYPLFHVIENSSEAVAGLKLQWFRVAFRSEYLWESGSMFPVTVVGREKLEAVLWWRTRYLTDVQLPTVYYDYGAWTGWKDDLPTGTAVIGGVKTTTGYSSPFMTNHMPVAAGPILPSTVELTAHLVLLANRRGI